MTSSTPSPSSAASARSSSVETPPAAVTRSPLARPSVSMPSRFGPDQRAVAHHVGVLDPRHPPVLDLRGQLQGVHGRDLVPARHRDLARSGRRWPPRPPPATAAPPPAPPRARDAPRCRRSRGRRRARGSASRSRATRRPPPTSTGMRTALDHRRHRVAAAACLRWRRRGPPRAGAAAPSRLPAARHLAGVAAVDGLVLEPPCFRRTTLPPRRSIGGHDDHALLLRPRAAEHPRRSSRPCAGPPPGSSRGGTGRPARSRAPPPPRSRGRSRRSRATTSGGRVAVVGVDEVDVAPSGDALEQRVRPAPAQAVPAHVRHGQRPSKRRTRPGSRPSPACRPCSSLSSKRSCMPMQMPSTRLARARRLAQHGRRGPRRAISSMVAPKAPSPGEDEGVAPRAARRDRR